MLFSIIALGSISGLSTAWAQVPERGPSYESVVEYSDASVRIIQPRIHGLRINNGSDTSGVCRALGFSAAPVEAEVESNTGRDNCERPSIRIDVHGRDAGRNACDMFNTNATIAAIHCVAPNHEYRIPTTYLDRYENEDGTVSLINPWFAKANETEVLSGRRYINEESDPNGVCRHFGLGAYVEESLVAEDRCEIPARRNDLTVSLDRHGRFKAFADCDHDMIIFISCRRR